MTKLEAVNKIMRRCGLHAVKTLDTDGTSNHAEAERCLDDSELEIQSRGWNYNTRINVELTPDANSKISVPTGIININPYKMGDVGYTPGLQYGTQYSDGIAITVQGDYVYDLINNTDVWEDSIFVTYIQRWEFHCIPFPIQDYIVMMAAARFNEKYGHGSFRQGIERDAVLAKVRALQANNNQSAVNVLNTNQTSQFYGMTNPSSPT
jgi:hypothetical protein